MVSSMVLSSLVLHSGLSTDKVNPKVIFIIVEFQFFQCLFCNNFFKYEYNDMMTYYTSCFQETEVRVHTAAIVMSSVMPSSLLVHDNLLY